MENKHVIQLYKKEPLLYSTNLPDVDPSKDISDNTFYIHLARREGDRMQDNFQATNEFSTGLTFHCPPDYYVEIVGSDALLRQGYMLPHSVMVIPKNKEEIRVKLIKFGEKDDLILPFRNALIGIVRNCNYTHIKKVKSSVIIDQLVREPPPEVNFF